MTFCPLSPDNGTQHVTSPHGMLAQARRASAGNSNMAAMAGLTQPLPVMYHFFFRKKSQFFPKHISLTVDTKELIQFEVQLTGKCQVEKYLYNQLQSPSRSRFRFQLMVSCASSTSDSQTTCRRAPVACVVPWEAPDNIDLIMHGP